MTVGLFGNTAICGVGYTDFSRASGRSVLSLAAEACRAAIADAGLGLDDVDGVASFAFGGDSVPCVALATALGLASQRYLLDMSLGGQAPCIMVINAAMAIATGMADTIVCFRALNGRSGQRVGSTEVGGPGGQYRYPIGFTAYPQYTAMWARRYMIETGATEADLGAVAVAQREYALTNHRAIQRQPLTLDDYFASPPIVDPYKVADCTAEVDGACAVVVTSLERARDLARPPAVLRSGAYRAVPRPGLDIGDPLFVEDFSRNYTGLLADELWTRAGIGASDIDVAMIYDCFTSVVLMSLEGLGFAPRGAAGELVRSGKLPINTNGGLLCEGYLHGMNSLAEGVLQVQGRAINQVFGVHNVVVTSGSWIDGSALVLSADD
jgi:acetyl-CoA acetyltransferase